MIAKNYLISERKLCRAMLVVSALTAIVSTFTIPLALLAAVETNEPLWSIVALAAMFVARYAFVRFGIAMDALGNIQKELRKH